MRSIGLSHVRVAELVGPVARRIRLRGTDIGRRSRRQIATVTFRARTLSFFRRVDDGVANKDGRTRRRRHARKPRSSSGGVDDRRRCPHRRSMPSSFRTATWSATVWTPCPISVHAVAGPRRGRTSDRTPDARRHTTSIGSRCRVPTFFMTESEAHRLAVLGSGVVVRRLDLVQPPPRRQAVAVRP